MKIAFDIDKTYEADPERFNRIAARFQVAGHQVGLLTGRNKAEGAIVSFTPDFCIFLDTGDLSYAARATLKAQTMKENGIDIIFDDRADYFPSQVVALHIL